jgi:signal recognition particle GTPase
MQAQEMQKQKERFKQMIEELSKKDTYTLKDFKKEIISQEVKKGFLRRMFTEAQPEEIQQEKFKTIMNAIKEEELTSSQPLNGDAKLEISQITQIPVKDINNLLTQFKIQAKLHGYLKARREKGDYIPQSQEELQVMLRSDRPPSTREERYEHQKKYSTKQRKWLNSLMR